MNRSRTTFCPQNDNRSGEQERRKQKLVLQLVPVDHARTYNEILRWILFEEEESKIAHLRNSEYEKQNPISIRPLDENFGKFATTKSSPISFFYREEVRSTLAPITSKINADRLTTVNTALRDELNTSASRKAPSATPRLLLLNAGWY